MDPVRTLIELLVMYTAVILIAPNIRLAGCEELSFCGLTPYDWHYSNESRAKDRSAEDVPEMFRKKVFPPSDDQHTRSGPSPEQILETLATTPFPVRMRVLYDAAFEAEFETRKDLESFVRNVFLSSQMLYESPEMYALFKMFFVIVRLERMRQEYPASMSSNEILTRMEEYQGPTHNDEYDVTFMLLFSHIFDQEAGPKTGGLLGMAQMGAFCNKGAKIRALLFRANSLNIGIVIAHELAHSLNAQHDGVGPGAEVACDGEKYIMSPLAGKGRDKWSRCTIAVITAYLAEESIYECVYNQERFKTKPINDAFDFSPNSSHKWPAPGSEIDADRQCQLAFDKSIRSMPLPDMCKLLYCNIDGTLLGSGGPALPGTRCVKPQSPETFGSCKDGECV